MIVRDAEAAILVYEKFKPRQSIHQMGSSINGPFGSKVIAAIRNHLLYPMQKKSPIWNGLAPTTLVTPATNGAITAVDDLRNPARQLKPSKRTGLLPIVDAGILTLQTQVLPMRAQMAKQRKR